MQNSSRFFFALLMLVLGGCNTTPVSRSQFQAADPNPARPSDGPKPSTDSPIEFLLSAAANDFHAHRPVEHFRHVRFGHNLTPEGAKQYLLCGEFLPKQADSKPEWTPFATVKMSDYEQWNGVQAATWCEPSKIVWDSDKDLSSSLENRLDSLR